jgi:ribonuclease HI
MKRTLAKPAVEIPVVKLFVDGAGARADGKGSGFAWISSTGEQHVEAEDGLTNNQAEYRALTSALSSLPEGAEAEIYSDSELMCRQMDGGYGVHDPDLFELRRRALDLISIKNLRIHLHWIPRAQNLADKLLAKQRKR